MLALYIATPRQWAAHVWPRQAELINAGLNGLQIALAEKGIPLLFREVDDFVASVELVKQVCAENSVTHDSYEVNERARDVDVERALRNVVCEGFDDSVILPPGAVILAITRCTKSLRLKNAWLKQLREGIQECVAAPKVGRSRWIKPAPSITLNYPGQSRYCAFPVEEKAAIARLRQCQNECKYGDNKIRQWKARRLVRQPGDGRVIALASACIASGGTAAGAGRWGR